MNHVTTTTAPVNGASTAQELFALTDEQILEIEPHLEEAGDDTKEQSLKADPSTAPAKAAGPARDDKQNHGSASAEVPMLIAEAKALKEIYPGGLEQARAAAERARALDEFDAAYFGAVGKSAEEISAARTALAQRMLKEDPATFREMVSAGLKALSEQAPASSDFSNSVDTTERSRQKDFSATLQDPQTKRDSSTEARNNADTSRGMTDEATAGYVAFEKAANAELEKSVGGAIERALRRALPLSDATPQRGGAQAGVPTLQERLGDAVRQEIEKALQGDRQLGEQVAQILSARRFDDASRAQVVRLIGERAGQLVPGATKRVLHDWTQTTLAAHRSRTDKQDGANARADLTPAQQGRERAAVPNQQKSAMRIDAASPPSGRIDYKKLSDEQILNM